MTRSLSVCWLLMAVFVAYGSVASSAEPTKAPRPRLNFKCELGELPADAKAVDVSIPIPPTNERQTIKLLNGADLSGGRFTKDKTFGNELYYQRFDVGDSKAPVTVELVYDVEVREATVPAAKQLISTTAAVPAGEFEPYLHKRR